MVFQGCVFIVDQFLNRVFFVGTEVMIDSIMFLIVLDEAAYSQKKG